MSDHLFTRAEYRYVAPPGTTVSDYFRLYTAELDISYVPDVFGLVRREMESLEAQAEAQQFQLERCRGSNPGSFAAGSDRGDDVATETDLLGLLRRQFELGQVAKADVLLQEAALAQAQETLPPLEKQLAQQRDLLTALAGRYPSQEIAEKFTLDSLKLPREQPVSIPSKLVEHRPDVKAAEAICTWRALPSA